MSNLLHGEYYDTWKLENGEGVESNEYYDLNPTPQDVVDCEIEVLGDYPDFTDSYINLAYWKDDGRELTDTELDRLNDEYPDYVYDLVEKTTF